MSTEKTFGFQNSLPNLPVPPLKKTLQKYLDSVQPLATKEQFERTRELIKQFEDGLGRQLQKKLEEKGRNERNWLERWWEEDAYLIGRYPIWPLVNFGGAGPRFDRWPPKQGTQAERSALITYWVLRYWQSLRTEELAVQRSRNVVWDMNQSYRFFNACRLPGETKDSYRHFFRTASEGSIPSHIVIMYQGKFWKLNVCDSAGRLFTPVHLQRTFEFILHSGLATNGSHIGALTCSNRTDWWKNREHLLSLSPLNREYFDVIESSIFILSFSDESPMNDSELAKYSIAGDPRCQYADKSFVWHFFKNGLTCSTGEHGNMDAITMILLNIFVDDNVVKQNFKWKGDNFDKEIGPEPIEMRFVIDNEVKKAVNAALEVYRPLANDLEVLVWHFKGYGTDFAKQNKVYADTVVQIALQLAYFKLHNKSAATYETASTRKFFHGRTETVRSCTSEAVAFSKIMLDPKCSLKEKVDSFKKAVGKHDNLMKEAMDGQGCDRHLLGLRRIAAEIKLPEPEIFFDPSWKLSGGDGNFLLSTSFVGYSIVYGGVSPMCTNGYGTFYKMMKNDFTFVTTAWKSCKETNLPVWRETVEWALKRIGELLPHSKL